VKVKLKRTGQVLVVRGPAPKAKGDRFTAAPAPKAAEPKSPARGCVTGTLPGGGTFIACSRGSKSAAPMPDEKVYRYDPELHEVVR